MELKWERILETIVQVSTIEIEIYGALEMSMITPSLSLADHATDNFPEKSVSSIKWRG